MNSKQKILNSLKMHMVTGLSILLNSNIDEISSAREKWVISQLLAFKTYQERKSEWRKAKKQRWHVDLLQNNWNPTRCALFSFFSFSFAMGRPLHYRAVKTTSQQLLNTPFYKAQCVHKGRALVRRQERPPRTKLVPFDEMWKQFRALVWLQKFQIFVSDEFEFQKIRLIQIHSK